MRKQRPDSDASHGECRFVALEVLAVEDDTYTILNPFKIVAVQWQEHDDRAAHKVFCEGGHTFDLSAEAFEDLLVKATSVGADLSWITGVSDSVSDGGQ